MPQTTRVIPCHVIAGPLGVGKTTAMIDLVRRQRGREFIAVLVNDFGTIGIDGVLVDSETGDESRNALAVESVPGGCICCTAAAGLHAALQKILAMPEVDRIMLEPSGMVATGQLIDVLHQVAASQPDVRLEVRPVVVMFDPSRVTSDMVTTMPYFSRLVEAADVLVANRCDLASDAAMAEFREWAGKLYPPKMQVLETKFGVLPDDLFDWRLPENHGVHKHDHTHAHDHEHHKHEHIHQGDYHAEGLQWPATVRFGLDKLRECLTALLDRCERLKGVFHTDMGWQYVDIAAGRVNARATEYRRDNRVDWITAEDALDAEAMREHLEAARIDG